jgi:hypothetical protein
MDVKVDKIDKKIVDKIDKVEKITDEIDDNIEPETNSIKEIRIDGFLDKKYKWNGTKWVDVCRLCINDIFKNSVCEEHYKQQLSNNIIGEIVIKHNKSYIWNKEWKLLCSTELCKKQATKGGKCHQHHNNPITMYSSQQNSINIFHGIKEDMLIKKQKEKKQREREKKEEKEKEKE